MRMPADYNPARGQTALEYILLLAVVAVVVLASFSPGSLIDQVHKAAGGYYNTVSSVIMDSDGATNVHGVWTDKDNPQPINGGWCPVTCPTAGNFGFSVMYGSCECPAPAFGGAFCPGGVVNCSPGHTCRGQEVSCGNGSVSPCGPCPNGQSCVPITSSNPTGCACPNGLICNGQGNPPSPIGSIPLDCSTCGCPQGEGVDPQTNTCVSSCPPCYTLSGAQCVPVNCPANSFCNPSLPTASECACDQFTYWNGSACAYCTPAGIKCTKPASDGTSCVAYNCPNNEYCDTTPTDSAYNSCACIAGTHWNGTACVPPGNGPCTPATACSSTLNCSSDSCGTSCGTCPSSACSSATPGVPGTCGACVPTLACPTLNGCGTDTCGKSCGTCSGSQTCSTATPGVPGTCSNTCTSDGTCTVTSECGIPLGIDNCGRVCIGTEKNCPTGQSCDSGQCICPPCIPIGNECGTTEGVDNCGNSCIATAEVCPSGQQCNMFNECACQSNICIPIGNECGTTQGVDDCGNPCTATAETCLPGEFCNTFHQCACKSDGSCTPPPGTCTSEGFDNCGDSCNTATPLPCGSGAKCDAINDICECLTPNICPTGAVCGPDTCGDANGCNGPNACPSGDTCVSGQCVCVVANGNCTSWGDCTAHTCGASGTETCLSSTAPQCGGTTAVGTTQACTGSTCANGGVCTSGQCVCTPVDGTCTSWGACSVNSCGANGTQTCLSSTTPQCGGNPAPTSQACAGSSCPNGEDCTSGKCVCTPGVCPTGNTCGVDTCGNQDGCGVCADGETCSFGQCTTTFTLQITDYGNCRTCAGICSKFNLAGNCGGDADCGSSCGISYNTCVPDSTGEGWDCGSCLSETVSSGTPCAHGIASVISQGAPTNVTQGTCGSHPTQGSASITYTVTCNA